MLLVFPRMVIIITIDRQDLNEERKINSKEKKMVENLINDY